MALTAIEQTLAVASEAAEKSRHSRDRAAPGAAFRCRADLRVHGR